MARRPRTIAKKIIQLALGKKAEDVMLFDLRKITAMTDFFVICTGTSDVQVRAIAGAVIDGCKKEKVSVYSVEGLDAATWVLIDLVDVVVHVFKPDVRKYYQLERLWGDAVIETFDDDGREAIR
ncbi:MAG: ribosome silencing factor [Candidatus Krumholzibacteriia bacterium]